MDCSVILACPVCGRCPRQEPHYQQDVEIEFIYVPEQENNYCIAAPIRQDRQSQAPLASYTCMYQAFNRGLQEATGELVCMMHVCDRFAAPTVLAKVLELLDDPQLDAVYADLAYITGPRSRVPIRYWRSGYMAPENLACGWAAPLPAFVVRRQALERIKLPDGTIFTQTPWPDPWQEAFLRMTLTAGMHVRYVPEVWVEIPTYSPTNQLLARMIGCQDIG